MKRKLKFAMVSVFDCVEKIAIENAIVSDFHCYIIAQVLIIFEIRNSGKD